VSTKLHAHLTSVLNGGSQLHDSAALFPGTIPYFSLNTWLGGEQSRFAYGNEKKSCPLRESYPGHLTERVIVAHRTSRSSDNYFCFVFCRYWVRMPVRPGFSSHPPQKY